MTADRAITLCVAPEDAGMRLDRFLAGHVPGLSRTAAQRLIDEALVAVSGQKTKASLVLEDGWSILVELPAPRPSELVAEAIPLDVLYEDDDLVAVNKPCGMVVHPAPGHSAGTLVHALLAHCRDLSGVGGEQRPGILHRLDKNTSGVIIAAKSDRAHIGLSRQFAERHIYKEYRAIVAGLCKEGEFTRTESLGRDRGDRKKISWRTDAPRAAQTDFRVLWAAGECSELLALPRTGRTHQIRVHLQAAGHPVLNDDLYGGRQIRSGGLRALLKRYPGFLLHAWRLTLTHPVNGGELRIEAPLPAIFAEIGPVSRETATEDPK